MFCRACKRFNISRIKTCIENRNKDKRQASEFLKGRHSMFRITQITSFEISNIKHTEVSVGE